MPSKADNAHESGPKVKRVRRRGSKDSVKAVAADAAGVTRDSEEKASKTPAAARRVTAVRRIVHEASFLATSLLRLATLRRADVLVVVSPPLAAGVPAWVRG